MIKRNTEGWIRVSEGPQGVYVFIGRQTSDTADLPTEGLLTGSIALQQGTGKKFLYHETDGWKEWS